MIVYLESVWGILLELAPWLFVGAAVSGLIHVLLPKNFVRHHLTGSGSVLKAVAMGVPMPLCSCGVIPAGLGLKKDGASDGASVGFLISTPQTGVDSILVAAAFLGWPFALFKVAAAAITGLTGGWLTERFGGTPVPWADEAGHGGENNDQNWRAAVAHGEDLIRSIWGWLVVGVLVSAAITAWIPAEGFDSVTSWGPIVTLLTVLVISLPLYVCATASVPIAASLVASGFPTGAALVFLMAGPATNLATIGTIQRAFGRRVLGLYLSTIIVGSVGLGLLFDAYFTTAVVSIAHHGEHDAWWATATAIALTALLVRYAASDLKRWWTQRTLDSRIQDSIVIGVEGMTCGGCVSRLEGVLQAADGIEEATVTLKPGQAIVSGSVDEHTVHGLIEGAGFQVTTSSLDSTAHSHCHHS